MCPTVRYTQTMLLCPVRDCHLPLVREKPTLACANGHSFDIARSGYINLLQPQDRRSKNPGDANKVVSARRRLHDLGVTQPLQQAISEIATAVKGDTVLDAGCGDGFYLGTLAKESGFEGHGIDISIPAVNAAAKRYSDCEWIVANGDRFIPYADSSFSLVLSITGRMNPDEFRRIMRDHGRLLVAVPAPDDLIELRGTGREDRVARTIETFMEKFGLIDQQRTTSHAALDAAAVQDVLVSIYRPMTSQPVTAMGVTFSLDLLLFKPK